MLYSLAAQMDYYRNLIQSHPKWEYIGVYADEAYAGTKSNRPEFTQMLSICRAGEIDMNITKSISRFARNTVTLLETVRELKTLGIDVFFEEQHLHSASADGELMLTILASYAQEESLSASENCKQKCYVVDQLTKRKIQNNGQLPQYYVEDSHEGIIDHEIFEAVHAEMARRSQKYKHPVTKPEGSEFTGLITCGRCGAHFRQKINVYGTKYAKPTWICLTYSYRGKEYCPVKRIPEDILKQKSTEVLGLFDYDSDRFREIVSSITVPEDGILVFTFHDGSERTITWENRSKRESWTPAMREAARVTTARRQKNGYCSRHPRKLAVCLGLDQ